MSAGLPTEVTAFGTCRCVSGQFRQPRSSTSHPRKKSRNQPWLNPPSAFLNFFEFTLNQLLRRPQMKRVALLFLIASGLVPAAFAQETGNLQVGVYADYFRLQQTKTNFAGLGARVGSPAFRNLSLEGELNYGD